MHSSALQQPLYPMLPHAMQVGGGEGGGGKGGGGEGGEAHVADVIVPSTLHTCAPLE